VGSVPFMFWERATGSSAAATSSTAAQAALSAILDMQHGKTVEMSYGQSRNRASIVAVCGARWHGASDMVYCTLPALEEAYSNQPYQRPANFRSAAH
jgi:hypothetical protein